MAKISDQVDKTVDEIEDKAQAATGIDFGGSGGGKDAADVTDKNEDTTKGVTDNPVKAVEEAAEGVGKLVDKTLDQDKKDKKDKSQPRIKKAEKPGKLNERDSEDSGTNPGEIRSGFKIEGLAKDLGVGVSRARQMKRLGLVDEQKLEKFKPGNKKTEKDRKPDRKVASVRDPDTGETVKANSTLTKADPNQQQKRSGTRDPVFTPGEDQPQTQNLNQVERRQVRKLDRKFSTNNGGSTEVTEINSTDTGRTEVKGVKTATTQAEKQLQQIEQKKEEFQSITGGKGIDTLEEKALKTGIQGVRLSEKASKKIRQDETLRKAFGLTGLGASLTSFYTGGKTIASEIKEASNLENFTPSSQSFKNIIATTTPLTNPAEQKAEKQAAGDVVQETIEDPAALIGGAGAGIAALKKGGPALLASSTAAGAQKQASSFQKNPSAIRQEASALPVEALDLTPTLVTVPTAAKSAAPRIVNKKAQTAKRFVQGDLGFETTKEAVKTKPIPDELNPPQSNLLFKDKNIEQDKQVEKISGIQQIETSEGERKAIKIEGRRIQKPLKRRDFVKDLLTNKRKGQLGGVAPKRSTKNKGKKQNQQQKQVPDEPVDVEDFKPNDLFDQLDSKTSGQPANKATGGQSVKPVNVSLEKSKEKTKEQVKNQLEEQIKQQPPVEKQKTENEAATKTVSSVFQQQKQENIQRFLQQNQLVQKPSNNRFDFELNFEQDSTQNRGKKGESGRGFEFQPGIGSIITGNTITEEQAQKQGLFNQTFTGLEKRPVVIETPENKNQESGNEKDLKDLFGA